MAEDAGRAGPMREGFRARLRRGDALSGVWSTLNDPVTARILALSGFDFVSIDLQHGYADFASATALIDALRDAPAAPLVRVPGGGAEQIGRALDLGAEGVIVPMVDGVEDAVRAARACRYAPAGTRSWGPLWQGVHPFADHTTGDERATCIVMIETLVDRIAEVPGVDAVYVGPNDLALSAGLGRVPCTESPELTELIEGLVRRARAVGLRIGVDAADAAQAALWRSRGVDFQITASDTGLLAAAARSASPQGR
jgi:4-hydroxy-2-oxoheptanedioate aldolase